MKRSFSSRWQRFGFQCRQVLWPSMGWQRFFKLFMIRLSKMRGGDTSIAKGVACGAAVSMTPFVGLHFIISILLARLLRCNWIAAMLGTIVGNPWTFPFIWVSSFQLGRKILHQLGNWSGNRGDGSDPGYGMGHGDRGHHFHHGHLEWEMLWNNPEKIFLPMLVGSIPMFIVSAVVFYVVALFGLRWFRSRMDRKALRNRSRDRSY